MFPALTLMLTLLQPAHAVVTWPSTAEWATVPLSEGPITDSADDATPSSYDGTALDIVGNGSNPALQWFADSRALYFRIRVDKTPENLSTPYYGAWGVLLSTDSDADTYEYSIALSSDDATDNSVYVLENADGGVGVSETAEDRLYKSPGATTDLARFIPTGDSYGGGDDYFLDLQANLTDIASFFDESTVVRVVAVTDYEGASSFAVDMSTASDMSSLSAGLSDPIAIDQDADSLTWFEEQECGSDPTVDDIDADGLSDAEECNAEGFDPNDSDSDNDGVDDYFEYYCRSIWSGSSENDRDADGVPDSIEGTGDIDGDTYLNFCDQDADGDGTPDSKELDGDSDCDGVDDLFDSDDTDGTCGSDDTDTDSDSGPDSDDTASCGPDELCGGHFKGGGCSSVPLGALLVPALLAGLLLMGRRARLLGVFAIPMAHAGGIESQTFRPVMDGAFFGVEDATVSGNGVGGGLVFNLSNDPLVYQKAGGNEIPIVSTLGTADALLFGTYRPVRLGIGLPMNVVVQGESVEPPYLIGDLSLDAKVAILDRRRSPVGVGLSVDATFPTGNELAWLGQGMSTGSGSVLLSHGRRDRLVSSLNLGAGSTLGGAEKIDGFYPGMYALWAAGLSFPLTGIASEEERKRERLRAVIEASGKSWLYNDVPNTNPVEIRAGLRALVVDRLVTSFAVGQPLSSGIGTPDWRVIMGVTWVPARKKANALAQGPDADSDGVIDEKDLCPDQKEDPNGSNDEDGCPDARMALSTIKVQDPAGAPIPASTLSLTFGVGPRSWPLPEGSLRRALPWGEYLATATAPGYKDWTGTLVVPKKKSFSHKLTLEPSATARLIVARVTDDEKNPIRATVRILGERSHIQGKENGSVEVSRPPGRYEAIFSAPGRGTLRKTLVIVDGENSGLDVVLPKGHTQVSADRIQLLEMVRFETASARIEAATLPILDEVVEIILQNPSYRKIEIQGHTDDQGSEEFNLDLSFKRADAVMTYLVGAGVGPELLEAKGMGKKSPLVPGDSEEARRANRRVEFIVVSTAASGQGDPAKK